MNEMIYIEGGDILMGSNNQQEGPIHRVIISSFSIGKYPLTQREWCEVMEYNHSYIIDERLPVDHVTWLEAIEYCNRRSRKDGLAKCYSSDGINVECNWNADGYRLPTEAEWEYAARGGIHSKGYINADSDDLNSVGWNDKNSNGQSHFVGTKNPNELGIYDISGNVWEWCWDWYNWDYYKISPEKNPRGPLSGEYRILRGGSFGYVDITKCRVSSRSYSYPDFMNCFKASGLRICRNI